MSPSFTAAYGFLVVSACVLDAAAKRAVFTGFSREAKRLREAADRQGGEPSDQPNDNSPYIEGEELKRMLKAATVTAANEIGVYRRRWTKFGLPFAVGYDPTDPNFVHGTVFFENPHEEPILDEERCQQAARPDRYQFVWFSSELVSIDIRTYTEQAAAEAALAALEPDEFGTAGGVILLNNAVVKERVTELNKWSAVSDFVDFYHMAILPPLAPPSDDELQEMKQKAVTDALLERLRHLGSVAKEVAAHRKSEAGAQFAPTDAYAHRSEAWKEFVKLQESVFLNPNHVYVDDDVDDDM